MTTENILRKYIKTCQHRDAAKARLADAEKKEELMQQGYDKHQDAEHLKYLRRAKYERQMTRQSWLRLDKECRKARKRAIEALQNEEKPSNIS